MSRFYSKITADAKGTTTKCAHKKLISEINGWASGVRIEAFIDGVSGKDGFRIFRTAGSQGFKQDKLIGTVLNGEFTRAAPTDAAFPS